MLSDSEGEEEKEEEIVDSLPINKKIVKSTVAIKTQDETYEYDKYDIIDFLEPDYIDWLNLIPIECWDKYRKDVEKSFSNIADERVMDLVMVKTKINLPKYVVDNFEKITLEVLKYCVKINFTKLDTQIKKNDYKFNDCIVKSIEKQDLEFNKYFYEYLYFKLEPSHQYIGINTEDNFLLLEDIYIHKANRFYTITKKMLLVHYSIIKTNYKLIKYLNKIFPNIFQNIFQNNFLGKEIKQNNLYLMTFNKSKINNWDDIIELKNIINISNNYFSKKMLIGEDIYYESKYLLPLICKSGNVELVFKIINNFWSKELEKMNNIINIMAFSSLSKNYELVSLLYNFYTFEKNILFNADTCSCIAEKIIHMSNKKYHEYDKILYEWFNLGGVVKGYSVYTDYIESIKIKKNQLK